MSNAASNDRAIPLEQPDWVFVQRDQCNGRTMACLNCGRSLGVRHHMLCYALAIAHTEATRGSA